MLAPCRTRRSAAQGLRTGPKARAGRNSVHPGSKAARRGLRGRWEKRDPDEATELAKEGGKRIAARRQRMDP